MQSPKTRKELSTELGISRSTLYRRLKTKNIILPKGLISPDLQIEIYKKLGYTHLLKNHKRKS